MSDLKPGEAKIHWRFWVEAGPSKMLFEIPEWGDSLYLSEVPSNPQMAVHSAALLGRVFLETFLFANGVGPAIMKGKECLGFENLRVKVALEQKQEDGTWRSIP